MRRLIFSLLVIVIGIIALVGTAFALDALTLKPALTVTPNVTPNATTQAIQSASMDTFVLLPTFSPSEPCELQTVRARDDAACRSEWIIESLFHEQNGVQFIWRDEHVGVGCWHGINVDRHELDVCTRDTGERTTLTEHIIHDPVLSPTGRHFAYITLDMRDMSGLYPHVYRVNIDGGDMVQLDTLGLGDGIVSATELRWSDDANWVHLTLWNGTLNGWLPARLKADGSGTLEMLQSE